MTLSLSIAPVRGIIVPAEAKTPFMPVRALAAPQTTWTCSLPVSTTQTRSRSALGWRSAETTAATVKGFEPGAAVFDRLDIVAEHDQPLDDRGGRRIGVEMGPEPGDGRLHAEAPPVSGPRTSEGISSGRKP